MSEPLPMIDFEHFSKIDLRVATVTACEAHPNADKLLKVTLAVTALRPRIPDPAA